MVVYENKCFTYNKKNSTVHISGLD